MNEPTPRAMDAVRGFCDGIHVMARDHGGVYIILPIMGPDDRQIAYVIDPGGGVEQRIEAEPTAVEVVTLNGSVFDMLNTVADVEEGDG